MYNHKANAQTISEFLLKAQFLQYIRTLLVIVYTSINRPWDTHTSNRLILLKQFYIRCHIPRRLTPKRLKEQSARNTQQVKGKLFSNTLAWYPHEPRGEDRSFNKTYIMLVLCQHLSSCPVNRFICTMMKLQIPHWAKRGWDRLVDQH